MDCTRKKSERKKAQTCINKTKILGNRLIITHGFLLIGKLQQYS